MVKDMAEKTISAGDTAVPVRAKAVHGGTPVDLTDASAVRFIMKMAGTDTPVIDNPADLIDPLNGEMAYFFSPGETDDTGNYEFWFQASFPEGEVTYGPATLEIVPGPTTDSDIDGLIVTPEEVYLLTTEGVTEEDIARSQVLISALIDRNLFDEEWYDELSGKDQARLRSAVAFQSASPPSEMSSTNIGGYPAGIVTSMSSGDQSISFASGSNISSLSYVDTVLNPIAAMQLARLSWRQGRKTLFASAYLDEGHHHISSVLAPEHINTFAFGVRPITRLPDYDSHVWTPLTAVDEDEYEVSDERVPGENEVLDPAPTVVMSDGG